MRQVEIKNIILDLGNVIINLDTTRTARALEALMEVSFDGYNEGAEDVFLKFERGQISEELFINTLLSKAGPGVQAIDVITAWNAMLRDIPPHRIEMIKRLSERYDVYILSNTNAIHERKFNQYLQEHFDLNSLYDLPLSDVFFSHDIGSRKPEHECYKYVLQRIGAYGWECLFIDDHLLNIQSALAFGLLSVHKKPAKDLNQDYLDRLGLL